MATKSATSAKSDGAQGKRVLEIAGASGINSFFLGLLGSEVHMNEINPKQVDEHMARVERLPADLKKNFVA